jgi:hypothetical protein
MWMNILKGDYYFEKVYPLVLEELKKLNPDEIEERKDEKIIEVVFNRKTVFNFGTISNPSLFHDSQTFIFTYDFESDKIMLEVLDGDFNLPLGVISGDKLLTIKNTMNWIDTAKSEDFPQELDNGKLRDVLDEIEARNVGQAAIHRELGR